MADIILGPYVVGEEPAPLDYTFLDSAGAPLDLTGYTAAFRCREKFTDGVFSAAAAIPTGTDGLVEYTWSGSEFPTSGHYFAELWAGNGTNRFASLRIQFDVAASVGDAPTI